MNREHDNLERDRKPQSGDTPSGLAETSVPNCPQCGLHCFKHDNSKCPYRFAPTVCEWIKLPSDLAALEPGSKQERGAIGNRVLADPPLAKAGEFDVRAWFEREYPAVNPRPHCDVLTEEVISRAYAAGRAASGTQNEQIAIVKLHAIAKHLNINNPPQPDNLMTAVALVEQAAEWARLHIEQRGKENDELRAATPKPTESKGEKIMADIGLAWVEEKEVSHTTVRCLVANCCGCLDVYVAKTERPKPYIDGRRILIFKCNECGCEAGRGDPAGLWL